MPFDMVSTFDSFKTAETFIVSKFEKECPLIVYAPKEEEVKEDPWGLDIADSSVMDGVTLEVLDDLWGSDFSEKTKIEEIKDIEEKPTGTHFWIHALPLYDPTTEQLGKLKVWNEQDLIIIVPRISLDLQEIIIQLKDRIVIGETNYEISEVLRWGFWRDTEEYLLVLLNCKELTFERKEKKSGDDTTGNS